MPDGDPNNKCAGFNGNDAVGDGRWLKIADNNLLDASSAFTIGCWFKLGAIEGRSRFLFFKSSSFASGGNGYGLAAASVHFGTASDKRAQFGVPTASALRAVEASTFGDLSTATWYFVQAKVASGNAYIRINDGAWNSVSLGGESPSGNASDLQLGADNGFTNQTHESDIDSAFFAPSELSDTVLNSLYNSGAGKRWCQLTSAEKALFNAWWDLGEAAGATREDSTSNNLDLTEGDSDQVTQNTGVTSGACLPEATGNMLLVF